MLRDVQVYPCSFQYPCASYTIACSFTSSLVSWRKAVALSPPAYWQCCFVALRYPTDREPIERRFACIASTSRLRVMSGDWSFWKVETQWTCHGGTDGDDSFQKYREAFERQGRITTWAFLAHLWLR
jgi:hypothetical protein